MAAGSTDFAATMQEYVAAQAWGTIWTRPGLELRQRSLLNLGMLTALGRFQELAGHVRGALNNGLTEVEIREALLQAACYCGVPFGMEAFRTADKVISDYKLEQQKG
jgi:4-carboxymuconolactone decarboxylase